MTSPTRIASRVERQPAVRVLARVGLAAIGILHILIGIIALAVAFGHGGSADQSGALQAVVAVPGGLFVLWAVIVGLIFLALWQILQSITAHRPGEKLIEVAKCVIYAVLAGVTISIAAGSHKNSSSSEKTWSSQLLGMPGGVVLLAAIGLGIVAAGVVFVVNGVTHRFERDLRLPPNRWATITTTLGRVGYVSKGVALVIVGGLVVFGAITADPEKAGGLDGSLKALTQVPFGVVLLVLIALGLIAYGAFWCVRAFASRLKEQ
ncbi:DUF1206 domain-containing protein [Leifsonia sp. 2MCAF36]|uniref:DUF1206 domain-containing protein n=1 Tax=Leifsonia sp. 2MCAF36 TaxID=3232988 RepID=UPI003F99EB47